ncbi:MAG: tRNA epoxyqueuosine(34) reductase QueG [Chlorobi bacterium]|nr:tRNA epoxyqueuosine(34) reductase QueG [Chlorobiota bacterium]
MINDALRKARLSISIKEKAKELGFFDCGISQAKHLSQDEQRMEIWLKKGMNGEMKYLEKNRDKRYDPTLLVEGAKSVVSVLYNYKPKETLPEKNNFKISTYAYGKDYHQVIKKKLKQLVTFIEEMSGQHSYRLFVDSAPVLDRAWAHLGGLGFIGKNTCLINRKGGSWFFIGHIIIDLELEYEKKEPEKNFCGNCTLCLQACPTGALKPFELDARKCISYLTIEYRGEIPDEFKAKFDNWIFGCDICQQVCPWNRDVIPHHEPSFEPSDELKKMGKSDWLSLDVKRFNNIFRESAVKRAGFGNIKRNIRFVDE